MKGRNPNPGDTVVLEEQHFQQFLNGLAENGYQIIGPTIRDNAIVNDEIRAVTDLPIGWTDEQNGGFYRLKKRKDKAFFGYVVGPQGWKRFLFPSMMCLWQAKRTAAGFQMLEETQDLPRYAFIGVRACELHAMAVQDRVFMEQIYTDPAYSQMRDKALIIAVNCGEARGTCFCVSMKTGPKVTGFFDLALTELPDDKSHVFVIEVGSDLGAETLKDLPCIKADTETLKRAECISAQAAAQMGRKLDTTDIKALLYANYDHPRWDDAADRCLTCGNCTLVCPTCFCTAIEDRTDLTGEKIERWRKLDSCFTVEFSYIHGGPVRSSAKSRYRQWMTHKLATWIDQFGTSGCVGCGRCITWCPVGIDITEEARVIRENQNPKFASVKETNRENP